jgi:hypothetical protein
MLRVFLFLMGFGFSLIGSMYIISYLNLLTIGYNFLEYAKFIISRIECWLFFIGLLCIWISIDDKGGKNELYL